MNRYSRAAGYLLFIAGSSLSVWLGSAVWRGYDTHLWQETGGVIYQSRMIEETKRGDEKLFKHELLYRYKVSDSSYTNDHVYRTDLPIASEKHLAGLVQQFPIGSIQTVYFNPGNPAEAILIKGVSIQLLLAFVFALACFGVGMLSIRRR
tara:strand:+ start:9052 stop:9501 length:450 start_codon:yes stop_codon:yes gene_type:complete